MSSGLPHQHGAPVQSLAGHWRVYLMEAAELGTFMFIAGMVSVAFAARSSPFQVRDPRIQRALIGVALGLTAVAIIYSPFGRRSGAHFNPAVTLTYLRLHLV